MDYDVDAFRDEVARLDEEHHEGMRTMRVDLEELHAETRKVVGGASRRDFLIRTGIAATALTIGASIVPMSTLWSPAYGQTLTDGAIAAYAQSVELAAVAAYGIAISSGKVKTPAVAAAATLFKKHHQDHADAFGAAAGSAAVTKPNKTLVASLGPQFTNAADEAAIGMLAYTVENAAAATYLFALNHLTSPDAQKLTASIMPIEAGHAAALGSVLKLDPTKDMNFLPVTQSDALALDPTKNPA